MKDWKPGDPIPDVLDANWSSWFYHPEGGNGGNAPVASSAPATQPVAPGNSPTAPAARTGSNSIDYTGQRRSELIQNGALTPEQMQQQQGFVQTGPTRQVSLAQNATYNYDARYNVWVPGYTPSSADRQAAARISVSGGSSSPPSPVATPGAAASSPSSPGAGPNSVALNAIAGRGGLFTNEQQLADARAAGGNYLPGRRIDLGSARSLPDFISSGLRDYQMIQQLPYYQGVAGGPGRAGFNPFSRGILGSGPEAYAAAIRGMREAPASLSQMSLVEPEGYDPANPYANGMPSVATTYNGLPASLSIGTAGAEIRGGTAGGWGGDAGAILAAHGLAPSSDPLVNAAMAAAIANSNEQFSFEDPNAYTGPAGTQYSQYNKGGQWYTKNEYADGGSWSVPIGFGGGYDEYGNPVQSTAPAPYIAPVQETPYVPPVPPVAQPLPQAPALPGTEVQPNVTPLPYSATDQALSNQILAADRERDIYGYRNAMAGLPQDKAIQLGQGEVPTTPAPQGYYYRQFDPLGTTRTINEDLYGWLQSRPIELARQDYYERLGASRDAAIAQAADIQRNNQRLAEMAAANPFGSAYGNPYWFLGLPGFAGGGSMYPASQMPTDGRKSMVVDGSATLHDDRTGQPLATMSEPTPQYPQGKAELLTDMGNSLKIDPMSQQQPMISMQDYKYLQSRNPMVAASLAQMEMSGKPTAAMMEMTLGRIEAIPDNTVRQRALAAYGAIVNSVNQGRQAPPLAAASKPLDPVAISAAIKFAGEGKLPA